MIICRFYISDKALGLLREKLAKQKWNEIYRGIKNISVVQTIEKREGKQV